MKISVIEPDGQGGLAHFAYELCQALSAANHSVTLVTGTSYELRDLPHQFAIQPVMRLWAGTGRAGAAIRQRPWFRAFASVRRMFRGVKLTYEWLRVTRRVLKERPDAVILSEMAFPHLAFVPFTMRRAGILTAQICHEFRERDAKSRSIAEISLKASKFLFRQFDHIFFLSEAMRSTFLESVEFPPEQTSRIPHGSQDVFAASNGRGRELRRDLGIGEGAPVALYFGYIRPSKGIPDLIEAFALSSWSDKGKLLIAGHVTKFADVSELKEVADRHGVADRIILNTSYIPNELVAAYFEIAHAVVLPYRSASQSGVLHLAYGQSRPVIATRVGGLAEDVIDGETGILVPPGSVEALAKALDRMLDEPGLAPNMGRRAKELADTQFTWSSAARLISEKLEAIKRQRLDITVPGARKLPERQMPQGTR